MLPGNSEVAGAPIHHRLSHWGPGMSAATQVRGQCDHLPRKPSGAEFTRPSCQKHHARTSLPRTAGLCRSFRFFQTSSTVCCPHHGYKAPQSPVSPSRRSAQLQVPWGPATYSSSVPADRPEPVPLLLFVRTVQHHTPGMASTCSYPGILQAQQPVLQMSCNTKPE